MTANDLSKQDHPRVINVPMDGLKERGCMATGSTKLVLQHFHVFCLEHPSRLNGRPIPRQLHQTRMLCEACSQGVKEKLEREKCIDSDRKETRRFKCQSFSICYEHQFADLVW